MTFLIADGKKKELERNNISFTYWIIINQQGTDGSFHWKSPGEFLCGWFCLLQPQGPWTQISRDTATKMVIVKTEREQKEWQRAPISPARFIGHGVLIGGVLYMILNRLQRRRREWKTERKNSVTQTLRCMNSPCRQHAVNTDSPTGPRGTLCLWPLFPDAHWSVTTSGGVCELTPLSQGKLTLCAA